MQDQAQLRFDARCLDAFRAGHPISEISQAAAPTDEGRASAFHINAAIDRAIRRERQTIAKAA